MSRVRRGAQAGASSRSRLPVKSPFVAQPDPGPCVQHGRDPGALPPCPPAALTEAEEDEELEADEFVPVHLERVQVQDELLRPQHQRVQDGAGLGCDGRHVHLPGGQGGISFGSPSPPTACCRAPHTGQELSPALSTD